jgi:Ca-activated chloride channel family protein
MFRFPAWLAGALAALCALWAFDVWARARRRRVSAALGKAPSLGRSAENPSTWRRAAFFLRGAAVLLIFLALAGPQWGVELLPTQGAARQVVVAVDVSLSMQTPDVKPDRLARAKTSLSQLLDQMEGDRVGVVAFAGNAQIICPLTSDLDAAKELLGDLEVGAVPTPGTAIGSAIRTAAAMLGRYPGEKNVVLLTDGEDHRSDPLGAAKEAAASGVRVFTIGIGTPEGEPIPVAGGGYKKDARGSTVVSRLGEDVLKEVARTTGGVYSRSSPAGDEIADLTGRIKSLDPVKGLTGTQRRFRNRYQWPLAAAFLLLLGEMILPLLAARARASAALALILLASAAPARSALFEGALRDANKKFDEGKYEDALELYADASGRRPADPRPVFNAGAALYRLERDSDAAGAFESLAARKDLPEGLRSAALYNKGNAVYRSGDYVAAAQDYRGALSLKPNDLDARRNLAVALFRQKNPPPPNKKDKKNDPDKKDQKPDPQNKKPDQKQGGGQNQPPPRPQDSMTREDAERVLRAVAEREKAQRRQAAQNPANGRKAPAPKAPGEEDW